jgi:hypothetical protein
VNLVRQARRLRGARLDRKLLEKTIEVLDRRDRGAANGARGIVRLRERVDEEAALEVLVAEPLAEAVEDSEQSVGRRVAALTSRGLEPVPQPQLVMAFEDLDDQVVLRPEVAVERRLGDGCLRDDPVDAYGGQTVAREQFVGSANDPVAGVRTGFLGRRARRDPRST